MKLLLVDDEDFIRKGMCYTIPWEEHNLEIFEATNGTEAFEIALQIRPDIVLTDISMPVMNGFELTRKLNQSLPDTKVIILTAYDTADNLKEAIDVQVSGFLVKNANSSEILDTVLKIKSDLEHKQKYNQKINQIQSIYNENQMLIKSTLVHRFLKKEVSFSHFSKKCSDLVVDLEHTPIALMLVQCSCSDEKYALGRFLQYFHEYSPLCFFTENHVAVFILDTSKTKLNAYAIENLLPSIQPLVFGNFIAVMSEIQSWQDLPPAFTLLQQTLSHCFWNTDSPYIMINPKEKFESNEKITPYEHEKIIMKSALFGQTSNLQILFDEYYTFMKTHKASREDFLDSALRLIIYVSSLQKEDININEFDRLIHEAETPQEVLQLVISLFIPSPTESGTDFNTQIKTAINYMKKHYTEDLHLEDVAKIVYLSPGYFCRRFKKTTGYSFKEYLHQLRIETAKDLILQTDYKYYEIAEMVGYKNYKYFSSYFNKITGYSAREYRQKETNN